MFDKAGRLYGCEGDGRRMVRYEADGGVTVVIRTVMKLLSASEYP
jgi:hypothetical protein